MLVNICIALISGLIAAGIINYVSDVLPQTEKLSSPFCYNCTKIISWKEYFLYRRCPNCGKSRSSRSWVILIWMPIAFIILQIFPSNRIGFPMASAFLAYLILVFIIDLEHRLIFLSVMGIGVLLCGYIGISLHSWRITLIGGAVGAGIMLLLFILGKVFVRIVSRIKHERIDEEAMGLGDVYLCAVLGLAMGYPGIILTILSGIVLGGIFSAGYILWMAARKKYQTLAAIPYAPFFIISALILLLRR
jgi:prepilin signal peptidase PulO-like enzyme (type II secretory pathway)